MQIIERLFRKYFTHARQKATTALKSASISAADAATYIGISEANLYKLFKKDSFEVAYLIKAAEMLKLPVSSFFDEQAQSINSQIGDFNQDGSGNSQKVKVDKGQPQQDLVAALAACQRELALANALVAAKDETITLLRASFTRPT